MGIHVVGGEIFRESYVKPRTNFRHTFQIMVLNIDSIRKCILRPRCSQIFGLTHIHIVHLDTYITGLNIDSIRNYSEIIKYLLFYCSYVKWTHVCIESLYIRYGDMTHQYKQGYHDKARLDRSINHDKARLDRSINLTECGRVWVHSTKWMRPNVDITLCRNTKRLQWCLVG